MVGGYAASRLTLQALSSWHKIDSILTRLRLAVCLVSRQQQQQQEGKATFPILALLRHFPTVSPSFHPAGSMPHIYLYIFDSFFLSYLILVGG